MSAVIGLDLSLTSTGIAVVVDGAIFGNTIKTGPWENDPYGIYRRRHIADEIAVWTLGAPDLIVMEGPVARSNAVIGLAQLHGVALDRLRSAGMTHRLLIVSPSTLKKFATGTGNAPKSAMAAHLVRRAGHLIEGVPGEDEADAIWLALLGAQLLGTPLVDLPKTHTDHLTKLTLPERLNT